MTHERPRGLFGRLRSLIRGIFAIWVRDTERQNPRAVYEQAISERVRQYRELKEAVAGILYMRNKLEHEITERRAEIARLHDDLRRGVRRYAGKGVSRRARLRQDKRLWKHRGIEQGRQ